MPIRVSALKKNLVRVGRTNTTGDVVAFVDLPMSNEKKRREVASRFEIQLVELTGAIDRVTGGGIDADGQPVPAALVYEFTPTPIPGASATIQVRGQYEPSSALRDVLPDEPDPVKQLHAAKAIDPAAYPVEHELLIIWKQTAKLAVLDIDYHGIPDDRKPDREDLLDVIHGLTPRPVWAHVSHGGGVKAYYTSADGLEAAELAAAAAYNYSRSDRSATYEIASVSRHPAFSRRQQSRLDPPPGLGFWFGSTPVELGEMGSWFARLASPDAIASWLADRGLNVGMRLAHSYCPIDPGYHSHGTPVFVGDHGIFCLSCRALGKSYAGRNRPGWIPWADLVGGDTRPSRVLQMAKGCVHWAHAEKVMAAETPVAATLREPIYRSVLKLVHGPDDPRIDMIFNTEPIVRISGKWMFLDGKQTPVRSSSMGLIKQLPGAWKTHRDPETREIVQAKIDMARAETLAHPEIDLSHYGYYDLTPVTGAPVWGVHLRYPSGMLVLPDTFYGRPPALVPRYRPAADRMDIEQAWQIVESVFPGINRKFCELLIACKGIAEGDIASPMIVVRGVSGAGKSTTAKIVAGWLGDHATDVLYRDDDTRFRQAVKAAVQQGTTVVVDEIFKHARAGKKTPRQAMDVALQLDSKTLRSHEMYIGATAILKRFLTLFTDISLPRAVIEDVQLARRLVLAELVTAVDWATPMAKFGLTDPSAFRWLSQWHADAADAIVSDVVDRLFSRPTTLPDVVSACGFQFMRDAADLIGESGLSLLELWDVMRVTPAVPMGASASLVKRYDPERGYRLVASADVDSPLRDAWDAVADATQGDGWTESRAAQERGWTAFLLKHGRLKPSAPAIHLDIASYKAAAVYLRFRAGPANQPTWTTGRPADWIVS